MAALNDVLTAWKDRISNPLAGTFAVSWVITNHRFFLVIISGKENYDKKFKYIDEVLYPTIIDAVVMWVALPLIATLVWIYAIPWLSSFVIRHNLRIERDRANEARTIGNEVLLTVAEGDQLREDIDRHKAAARAAVQKLEQERDQHRKQMSAAHAEARALRARHQYLKAVLPKGRSGPESTASIEALLLQEVFQVRDIRYGVRRVVFNADRTIGKPGHWKRWNLGKNGSIQLFDENDHCLTFKPDEHEQSFLCTDVSGQASELSLEPNSYTD